MFGQVWEHIGHLLQATTLKGFVIDNHTTIGWNVFTKPFCNRPERISNGRGKEFFMNQITTRFMLNVQRVLGRNLLVWMRTVK